MTSILNCSAADEDRVVTLKFDASGPGTYGIGYPTTVVITGPAGVTMEIRKILIESLKLDPPRV